MGLSGGLLRRVFAKGRSYDCNRSSSSGGAPMKNKWVHSVRIYLCGNEANSKLIRRELEEQQEFEDSASHKSSDTNLVSKHNFVTESNNNAESYEDQNQDQVE